MRWSPVSSATAWSQVSCRAIHLTKTSFWTCKSCRVLLPVSADLRRHHWRDWLTLYLQRTTLCSTPQGVALTAANTSPSPAPRHRRTTADWPRLRVGPWTSCVMTLQPGSRRDLNSSCLMSRGSKSSSAVNMLVTFVYSAAQNKSIIIIIAVSAAAPECVPLSVPRRVDLRPIPAPHHSEVSTLLVDLSAQRNRTQSTSLQLFLLCYSALRPTETPATQRASSEREVLCVNLKKDPHLGLGKLVIQQRRLIWSNRGVVKIWMYRNRPPLQLIAPWMYKYTDQLGPGYLRGHSV